ncbi:phosphoethanolamine transferase domain-containing protein, partial [Hydrogenophaga sp.]
MEIKPSHSPGKQTFPIEDPLSARSRHRSLWPSNALLALWLALAGNLPLWQKLVSQEELRATVVLFASFGLVIAAAVFALLSLLSWHRLYRPLVSLLLLVTALNAYFMTTYGAVIDPSMMANVLHTDVAEVRDLLSIRLLLTVAGVAGPPLWWLWWRAPRPGTTGPQLLRNAGAVTVGLLLALAAVLAGYQDLASLMRNHKTVRYMISPLNTVYAAGRVAFDHLPQTAQAHEPVGMDARLGPAYANPARPPLLVFVVGETVRAENFGLNGYARPTTPVLADWQRQRSLVNFPNVTACGTNTEVSLPCIFS